MIGIWVWNCTVLRIGLGHQGCCFRVHQTPDPAILIVRVHINRTLAPSSLTTLHDTIGVGEGWSKVECVAVLALVGPAPGAAAPVAGQAGDGRLGRHTGTRSNTHFQTIQRLQMPPKYIQV